MSVNHKIKPYTENFPKWELVRAFVQEDECKLKKLLREIDPDDRTQENRDRNKEYREGAVLINVTKRTHDGMIGAVYRKNPEIELPESVDYLEDDADGGGMSLEQFSKKVLSNVSQTGWGGVLTDFPMASDDTTVEATKDRRANLVEYCAEQIINWRTENGKLSLVVLWEVVEVPVNDFECKPVNQYRELRLIDGKYWQRLWREEGETISMVFEDMVRDYNGKVWEEITFQPIGTINNDTKIDPSLYYSIAQINKGHYRNSADLEENCFVHGQLTLGITTDLDADAWAETNPNGVRVGARKGHYLGTGGGFHSVQAEPNQLADKLMERKEAQMMAIGARMIQNGGNEREVAVLARVGAETATLSSLANNVSDGISQCIEWAEQYMSPSVTENTFMLNQEFYPKDFDAQKTMALIQLYDRGVIADYDLHQNLQQASIISDDRDLETVQSEAELQNPLQGGMNDQSGRFDS